MAYAKVCMIPQCPEKSEVRITDNSNSKRYDMCLAHAMVAGKHYGPENIVIVDTWNGITRENVIEGTKLLMEKHND